MNLPHAFNTFFASALIIIIIFAECAVKYSSDRLKKKIFCTVLAAVFTALIADVSFNILNEQIKFIWPVIAASFLYVYLFIILEENKIDNLTGLDNRYSFFEYFNKLTRSRNNYTWKVSIVDINNFRSINEIYGYLEGDNALCSLAYIIKSCARRTDFTARYGGDEFVLVTKEEKGAVELIDRIEEELAHFNNRKTKPYDIEISYGFDTYIADGSKQIDEFLNYIDKLTHRHNEKTRRTGDAKQ